MLNLLLRSLIISKDVAKEHYFVISKVLRSGPKRKRTHWQSFNNCQKVQEF